MAKNESKEKYIPISDIMSHLLDGDVLEILNECIYDPSGLGVVVREKAEHYKNNTQIYAYAFFDESVLSEVILIEVNDDKTIEIIGIAVSKNKQKKGIGSKLIDFIRKNRNFDKLILETDNDAVGFYRKYGFEINSLGEKYPNCVRYLCEFKKEL